MSELYELPDGWEWKKISDIIVKTKNIIPKNNPQSNFTYIDISSINNDIFSIVSPKIILGKDAPSRAKKEVQINDILFATTRPNLKNIAIIKEQYSNPVASTGFCILRTNNTENKYLFFYLLSNIFYKQVEKYIRGAQYPAISDKDVKSIVIPLPPIKEQKRIVAKLDKLFAKIDKAIALHQQNIDEAEALMGAVLDEVFRELEGRYCLSSINAIIQKTKNLKPKNDGEKYFTYIDISSINNEHFIVESPKKILGKDAPSRAKKEIIEGDIVYATTRPNLKNIALINQKYENPIASTGFCVLRVNNKAINKFLFFYLLTNQLFEQIESNIRGAQYPAISDRDLKNCKIPLLPLNIQQKTVQYLDQISAKVEALKKEQKEKMQSLKDLKASILDKAFRGGI